MHTVREQLRIISLDPDDRSRTNIKFIRPESRQTDLSCFGREAKACLDIEQASLSDMYILDSYYASLDTSRGEQSEGAEVVESIFGTVRHFKRVPHASRGTEAVQI